MIVFDTALCQMAPTFASLSLPLSEAEKWTIQLFMPLHHPFQNRQKKSRIFSANVSLLLRSVYDAQARYG